VQRFKKYWKGAARSKDCCCLENWVAGTRDMPSHAPALATNFHDGRGLGVEIAEGSTKQATINYLCDACQ
jgi:hypothetical protein